MATGLMKHQQKINLRTEVKMKIFLKKSSYAFLVLINITTLPLYSSENHRLRFVNDNDPLNKYWPNKEKTVLFFEDLNPNMIRSLRIRPGFDRQEFIHRLSSENFSSKYILEIYPQIPPKELPSLRRLAKNLALETFRK